MSKKVRNILIVVGALLVLSLFIPSKKAAQAADATTEAAVAPVDSVKAFESLSKEEKAKVMAEMIAKNKQKDSIQKARTWKAQDLVAYYKENEVKADEGLKDKSIIVAGIIQSISKDVMDKPFVLLGGEFTDQVQCYFQDNAGLSDLKKGAKLTVEGTCNGYHIINVGMEGCVIIQNLK